MTEQQVSTEFITAVFNGWEQGGINYLVLRNYEDLPRSTANDIDILVAPAHLERAEDIMRATAAKNGFRLHNRAEFATLAFYFSHLETGDEVHFDLFTDLKWRSFEFLDSEQFLKSKVQRGLFWVPHPGHEAATNLLAFMIYTGSVKEKYKDSIASGFKSAKAEATQLLSRSYGEIHAREIVAAGSEQKWQELEAMTRTLRKALISRQVFLRPFKTLGLMASDARRFVRRSVHPPGLTLVLCGADGSGKSTVIKGLTEALKTTFSPQKGRHFHWKPPVLTGKRQAARAPTTDPHGQTPRNPAVSLIYFAVHWFEFFLGSHLRIRPATFRGGLVIIDRYYYDFFVDQRRYRLQVPRWIVRLGFAFLKKPELVVLLDAPPEILQSRKREVSLDETRRQRDAYLEMVRSLPNGYVIDSAQSPAKVVADLKAVILELMARRTEAKPLHPARRI